jgi:hypothetical protein
MKTLPKIPPEYLIIGVGAAVALGLLYWLTKQAGGALLGTSAAQTSSNFDGSEQNAYEGHGAIGTLGAITNDLSGGLFSSIGEKIGGWLAPDYDPNAPAVNQSRKQAIGDNFYDRGVLQ